MSPNTASNVAPTLDIRRPKAARRLARGAAFLCALAAISVLFAGCGRIQQTPAAAQDGYTVTMVAQPSTPVIGDGTLVVTLRDPAGKPVTGAGLQIEGNMSHAGMTPVMADGASGKDGVYRVPLTWTMAGDWYVDVKFTLPDGQKITRRFPLQVLAK